MQYKFRAKPIDVSTGGTSVVVLTEDDAKDMDVSPMDRVKITFENREAIAIVDLTKGYVQKGEVGVFIEATQKLKLSRGKTIFLEPIEKPASVAFIKRKMEGFPLTKEEIDVIIRDVMDDRLSDVELTAFMTSVYIKGLSSEEIVDLTKAIVASGGVLEFRRRPVLSKHSIGGVPGNRTSMIIVPIVASAGLLIPKTSSRAITSPAGTADTMEVLAPVDLSEEKIMNVVNKTNGCLVWGGAVNLAAADDKLIRIRHPLKLDPRGVLLASILAKKKAEGATHVLVDIPIGKGAKIYTKKEAEDLAKDFMDLGTKLDMEIQCIITPGYDPVGAAIGPALEAREILRILEGQKISLDLIEKSLVMAGILLEMGGKADVGKGRTMAQHILDSGRALQKFKEIIAMQGGNPKVKSEDVKIGKYFSDITSSETGRIHYLNVSSLSAIARVAGAPKDTGAGLYMHVEKGDKIRKGQKILTIYAESDRKLQAAKELYTRLQPVELEKVILGKMSTETRPQVYDVT